MITGAHSILYSTDAEADRAFLRDVLGLPNVDVGEGWLIFGLPPAEVAVHPSRKNDLHELYLMCDDANAFVGEMKRHRIVCDPVQDMGWGLLTSVRLPGGGKLGVYEPKHARPPSAVARGSGGGASRGKAAGRAAKAGGESAKSAKSAKSSARASARTSSSENASGKGARGSAGAAKGAKTAKTAKIATRARSSAGASGAGASGRARR